MRRALLILMLGWFTIPFPAVHAQEATSFNPDFLLADEELLDVGSFTLGQIQSLLSRGSLARYRTRDIDGMERSAAEIIWRAAERFSISPKFLLVLLQREQSLVEDPSPSRDQLNWAMGYAICDDCSKRDPRLKKFSGFAKQVHYAAQRIRESYLRDLDRRGYTESGIGPNREIVIDGARVTPANDATSVLYTYTPHLRGNANFVSIWSQWFASAYPSGTLLQDETSGGIWLIQDGKRRPIVSHAAFASRFNPDAVVQVSPNLIEQYAMGSAISFPNYSLLRSPRGTVFLLVDDTRRGFTSQEAFRAAGFSSEEIVDVSFADLSAYVEGEPITVATTQAQGRLMQDTSTGGVFFVENGLKSPIFSREILENRFTNWPIAAMKPADLDSLPRSEPIRFQDGTLIAASGSSDVFVVSSGTRRHIEDEATFAAYGWSWKQVVWTDERSVLLHPLGEPLTTVLAKDEIEIARQ